MVIRKFSALLAIAFLPLACSDKSPTQPASMQAVSSSASAEAISPISRPEPRSLTSRNVPTQGMLGTWGGAHMTITIGSGSALVATDCGHGTIDQPFITDARGTFDLAGTYVQESPGPIHPGGEVVHPARYVGLVAGKSMTFSVTEVDTGSAIGKFDLTQGVAGLVVKCD